VLKHVETWKRCVERGYRRVLVFEDDAVLAREFERVFAQAMDEADRLDGPYLIYLGCGDNKYVEGARRAPTMLLAPAMDLPATDATVLDRRAAELRLAYIADRKVTRPADWLMREADAAMGITQYWLREPIVEQGSMNGRFVSVLDDKRTDRGRRWNWLRFRWDRWRRRTLGSTRPDEARADAGEARARVRFDLWAVELARFGAAWTAIGAFMVTGLASAAAGVMVLALAAAPSCWPRLKHAFWQPLGRATLVMIAVLALAMLWSPLAGKPLLREWVGWRQFAWLFCALALFETPAARLRFAALFVAASVLTACAALAFWAFDIVRSPIPEMAHVVFRNHVTQGMAFAAGTVFAVLLAVHVGTGRRQRLLWSAAAAVLLAGLLFATAGRSGYIVLAVSAAAALVASLHLERAPKKLVLGGAAVLAATMALSPVVADRFGQAVNELRTADTAPQVTSMGMRVAIWRNTVEIVEAAPWFGHGLGSYERAYRAAIADEPPGWRARPSDDPHNQYLFFLAETGVFGLAAFLWWLAAALRQPAAGSFRVAGLALLLSWCATSLFSSHFRSFNEGHMIMIFLGVLLSRSADLQLPRTTSTAARTAS
jgi:O-antigen ligase